MVNYYLGNNEFTICDLKKHMSTTTLQPLDKISYLTNRCNYYLCISRCKNAGTKY